MTEINFNISNLNSVDKIIQGSQSSKIDAEDFQKANFASPDNQKFTGDLSTMRLVAEIGDLEKSTSQVNDAISILEKASNSSGEIIVALEGMRDQAVKAADKSLSVADRSAIDIEFETLFTHIQSLATEIPDGGRLAIYNGSDDPTESYVSNSMETNNSARSFEHTDDGVITIDFKAWNPALASRGNTVQQTVDPVTGLQLIAGNQFTPDGLISGGNDLPLGDPKMLDYDLAGNDDSISQGVANQSARATETQAYGSAVLWAGNPNPGDGKPARLNLLSAINAEYVLANIDKAISAASEERAKLSAHISELEKAGDQFAETSRDIDSTRNRIQNADFAVEASESSRNQIVSKEGSGLLAQVNAARKAVLEFLMK